MSRGPPFDYKHEKYIAGHSDVFKHVVLTACIKELQKVHPEGILLVDVFAGDGVYDLNECATTYNSIQYRKGILKVLAKYEESSIGVPAVVTDFIQLLVKSTGCTGSKDLDVYPGSPVYGQNLLRQGLDEHRLLDYFLDSVEWLKDSTTFQQLDAYDVATMDYITSNPSNKHPIYFLDPPYDDSPNGIDDYSETKRLAMRLLDHNPYATVIIWIPFIANHRNRYGYPTSIKEMAKEKAKTGRYFCSITVSPNELQGSGILICNPTSTFDDIVTDDAVHWIANTMHQGKDEYLVEQIMKKSKK